jgi:hypothetical protein
MYGRGAVQAAAAALSSDMSQAGEVDPSALAIPVNEAAWQLMSGAAASAAGAGGGQLGGQQASRGAKAAGPKKQSASGSARPAQTQGSRSASAASKGAAQKEEERDQSPLFIVLDATRSLREVEVRNS